MRDQLQAPRIYVGSSSRTMVEMTAIAKASDAMKLRRAKFIEEILEVP